MPLFWVVLAIIALAIEVLATHFVLLFVAIAALLAAALAGGGALLETQVVVFAVASVALPLLLRQPLLQRFVGRGVPSRAEALLGLPALVTEAIDPERATGRVTANGQDWKASSDTRIEAGEMAIVVDVDGIVLVVELDLTATEDTPSA